ncbi:ribonuclease Y, partial [Candidatus Dojkabacteria bacterium]|nr:ribonuclease Y [Candidatus Dojkabacteria bacterium]
EGKLEEIAQLTREEAKKQLLDEVEKDISNDIAKKLREAEEKVKFEADDKSKNILVDAMQRAATDYVAETTVTTVEIPNDDMKGRIIGKEGRNIKTFERLTGVDIIVDDVPGVITLSCFDPVRREVAAISLQRLLKDGRVHPGTIEEMVHKVKVDIAKEIKKTGEEVAYEAGFPNLPEDVIKMLGRFKYRFSYGQNLIRHSMEMVKLGSYIASELDADVELTKLACLLHDIGKVVIPEVEGKPHHHISGDVVRKNKMGEKLANAVESHHGDIEPKSVEAIIVYVADAISGARPGARRDNYEEYVKRVRALEDTATSFDGVKEAYAIHAGREVRVICKSEETNDEDVKVLANKIAKEIEKSQTYPGQVKVNVIREVRAIDTAK